MNSIFGKLWAKKTITDNSENVNNSFKKESPLSLIGEWNKIIQKYPFSLNEQYFFQAGEKIVDKDTALNFETSVIKPTFDNINKELKIILEEKKQEILNKISALNVEIKELKNSLLEKDGNHLFTINQKIKNTEIEKKNEEEIAEGLFPEKRLQKMVEDNFKNYKDHLAILDSGKNKKNLDTILEYNTIIRLIKNQLLSFSKLRDSFSEHIHSHYYPPKKRYIVIFYTLCLLLLIGEIGFSYSIINDFIRLSRYFPKDYKYLKIIASLNASISMSVSLAAILKYCADHLLFKKDWQFKMVFWFIFLTLFFIILNFYSYQTIGEQALEFSVTKASLMKTFFSVSFALANALIFREAIYLHHLHARLSTKKNSSEKLEVLKEQKNHFINNVMQQISAKEKELRSQNDNLSLFKADAISEINNMSKNLEVINVSMFWYGFDSSIDFLMKNNKYYDIVIRNTLKNKLKS